MRRDDPIVEFDNLTAGTRAIRRWINERAEIEAIAWGEAVDGLHIDVEIVMAPSVVTETPEFEEALNARSSRHTNPSARFIIKLGPGELASLAHR